MMNAEKELNDLAAGVAAPDERAADEARRRQAGLAKPPGSLGRLEDLSVRIAGITGKVHNRIEKKNLLVFCADNGVVAEGVASTPQSVTAVQTVNLAHGKTGAAVIAGTLGCAVTVVDVGVNAEIGDPAVLNRKLAYGTKDIAVGAAMTREQAVRAVLCGAETAVRCVREGADILGVGEMGIGNTTTSAAVLSVLTGRPAREVAGRGAGLTDEAYERKLSVIEQAVAVNRPDADDIPDVLAKVGGLDIAAMAGAFLGGAGMRVPVVTDGFISAVAALCACRLCPAVRGYLLPSHASREIGHRIAMKELGLEPLFDLGMRLGEGSGCPIAMMLAETACAVLNDMATFAEAGIDTGYLDGIRGPDAFAVKGE